MSSRKVLKGTSFLSIAEIVNQGCSLLRNIILARYLAKADFGVAALLGLILTVFEMTSKMALGQQLIQSKNGDDPSFLDHIHCTQLGLSTLSTLLILVFAWPLAHYFAGPQYLASIMLLAFIPFVTGFIHLEVFRRTRELSFGPMVLAETVPQVIATLAAWPLAVYFKDYRAMLWLLLGKAILYSLMTQLLAKRRFTPRYNARLLRESLRFGWPLLLSGFIQLGNFQGDSMVIAAGYTLAQLGEFSVALTIAMAPGFLLIRISNSVSLPLLSAVQSDPAQLNIRYAQFVELMALLACFATLGMVFCGEDVVTMLYGMKYTGIGVLACWLTAGQSLRIIRNTMGCVAMACGDTVNNLISSTWRLSGLPLAIGVGFWQGSLTLFAVTAALGELIASSAVLLRLSSKHQIKPRATLLPATLGLGCVLLAAAIKWGLPANTPSSLHWILLGITLCLSTGIFMVRFPALRVLIIGFALNINSKLGAPLPLARWLPTKGVTHNTANNSAGLLPDKDSPKQ